MAPRVLPWKNRRGRPRGSAREKFVPPLLCEPRLMRSAFGSRVVLGERFKAIHDELDRAKKNRISAPSRGVDIELVEVVSVMEAG